MSDAYCKKHFISYCPNLSADCPYCRIEKLEAENTRIVAEAKQCHEQNDSLVSEHILLGQRIRELEAVLREGKK